MTELIRPSRRKILTGIALLFAAPAIVRAASLMPVKALPVLDTSIWLVQWGESTITEYYGADILPTVTYEDQWPKPFYEYIQN